jgi:hypothetical protein
LHELELTTGFDVILQEDIEQTIAIADNGFIDSQTAEMQSDKVHIRGVDELTTDDIKKFATDHFSVEPPIRIEWIDDTSANIVYSSEETGLLALIALTQLGEEDPAPLPPSRLRSAKSLFTHPDSVLQVRAAVKTDRKKPRAHEASRFYLMHPEHDPREKLRRELADRRRHDRRDQSEGDYRRRVFDEREHRRRREKGDEDGFSSSMYDDNMDSGNGGRGSSTDRSDTHQPKRGRQKELFPEHGAGSSGRLKDRSASPGVMDTDESDPHQSRRRRFRERSPRASGARVNESKELFPVNRDEDNKSRTRELFPNKTASSFMKKEVFHTRSSLSNHRRSDAFDAANDTADLFSKKISVPLVDGPHDAMETADDQSGDGGLSIRGAASNSGVSIRGSANGIAIKGGSSVRELFPDKFNSNAGKELFSDKLEGRGGQRRKAEDMFL